MKTQRPETTSFETAKLRMPALFLASHPKDFQLKDENYSVDIFCIVILFFLSGTGLLFERLPGLCFTIMYSFDFSKSQLICKLDLKNCLRNGMDFVHRLSTLTIP
jgi:hypothetical protein